MMENLTRGVAASKLFRTLMQDDPAIDARELGYMLTKEFPDISPAASMSIRKWLSAANVDEFPDEQIDGLILHYLNEAGYVS